MNRYDLAAQLPRSVVVRVGGKIRAAKIGCCDSCHEDVAYGFYGESFLDDERYYVLKGPNAGSIPWALRFCCCVEMVAFEKALEAEIARRSIS